MSNRGFRAEQQLYACTLLSIKEAPAQQWMPTNFTMGYKARQ